MDGGAGGQPAGPDEANVPGVSVLQVEWTRDADWTALGWQGAENPIPVIYLGTPGSQTESGGAPGGAGVGNCRAVVKVPLTEEAKSAVRHEAEVLEALAAERYEHSPRLLHVDWGRASRRRRLSRGVRDRATCCRNIGRCCVLCCCPGETTTLAEHAEQWAQEMIPSAAMTVGTPIVN